MILYALFVILRLQDSFAVGGARWIVKSFEICLLPLGQLMIRFGNSEMITFCPKSRIKILTFGVELLGIRGKFPRLKSETLLIFDSLEFLNFHFTREVTFFWKIEIFGSLLNEVIAVSTIGIASQSWIPLQKKLCRALCVPAHYLRRLLCVERFSSRILIFCLVGMSR